MLVSEERYTIAEFETYAAEHDERRFELIDGRLVEHMPTQLHALIVALLTTALTNYLRENPLGHALVEARYNLPGDEHNARVPDLSFVTRSRGELTRQGAAPYMPDLAVEVQSPDQSDRLLLDKATYYLANGAQMVWLIYPEKRLVEVFTATDRRLLIESDTLDGDDLLPGFTLELAQLFAQV